MQVWFIRYKIVLLGLSVLTLTLILFQDIMFGLIFFATPAFGLLIFSMDEIKLYNVAKNKAIQNKEYREDKIVAAVIIAIENQNEILRAQITQDVIKKIGYDKIYKN